MKVEPADSGVIEKINAELIVPDPIKIKAMEIINGNTGTNGDNPCCSKQDCTKS